VLVSGRYGGGDFSSGIDTADDLKLLAGAPHAGLWTNRIDRIAPLVEARR
jgi:glycerophosphoryl diester phosphodiesterase